MALSTIYGGDELKIAADASNYSLLVKSSFNIVFWYLLKNTFPQWLWQPSWAHLTNHYHNSFPFRGKLFQLRKRLWVFFCFYLDVSCSLCCCCPTFLTSLSPFSVSPLYCYAGDMQASQGICIWYTSRDYYGVEHFFFSFLFLDA